jgi:hypothetical protein
MDAFVQTVGSRSPITATALAPADTERDQAAGSECAPELVLALFGVRNHHFEWLDGE